MGIDQERHRPGLLKQQNKAHKHGRHRSKGAIHVAEKGKIATKVVSRKFKNIQSREGRRNQMIQNRLKKRQEALMKKRQLGSFRAPPFLVAVVPLNFYADIKKLMNFLKTSSQENELALSPEGVLHINVTKLKQKFSFVLPQEGNMYAVLDCLKVADTVLFVVSALAEPAVDAISENIIMAVLAQGLPSTAVAVLDLENIPMKKRSNYKQDIQKLISQWLPEEKIIQIDKEMDALNLLRKIGNQKQRPISQRDIRPHLLAEQLEFNAEEGSTFGILKVSGYLRGQILSVNSLIHIPGWGDFQMRQIDGLETHHSSSKEGIKENMMKVLEVADPSKQASLMSENIPDPMDAEQTWPTEEELQNAEKQQKQKKLIKRIPKGMSDYQACWIPEEEIEEVDEDAEDDFGVEKPMAVDSDDESQRKVRFDDEEYDIVTVTEGDMDPEKYDENIDIDEERKAQDKLKEAKMDQMFPDEIDTPLDVPARQRFQKYRGLASFRTSPWDPKENLPYDYARIFQFENFNRTRKRIFKESEDEIDGITPGTFITIHVDKVPAEVFNSRHPHEPVIVFGILEHEQKMSVINLVLKRYQNTPWADIPIKSKEELLIQCGYRRYKARPIFSEHTNGTKHKYQRYFQPNSITVATLYAPIIFPPASVLVFKENPNGTQDVIATGNVLSVNPDRLVIKRVVLSGHPFKVNKKSAVIRFMFFNREDIAWFKPIELRTKYGRRGHIKEPLGTHGHMKTVFDGQIKSQDTILMFLYKRVFPKWTYDPVVKYTNSNYKMLPKIPEEMEEEMK